MGPSGYWPAEWPVECGANHRPKTTGGPGLDIRPTDRLVATTRRTGRWPVMFVQRDRGQLYLHGTTLDAGADAAGWVERVDPATLEPTVVSRELPTGGHEWCGSLAVHANGDLYTVNGSYLHRLDPGCRVVAERALPVDHAHNGLLILGDGSIVTKDIRLGDEPSTLTVLDPDLNVLDSARLPEASMGRPAALAEGDGDTIYLPGSTRLFRYRWDGRALEADPTWRPTYREPERGGLAWDVTISDGRVWLLDNGSVPGVRRRVSGSPAEPAGPPGDPDEGPGWDEAVRLLGIDTATGHDVEVIVPTELPSGWVIAPPLVSGGVAVAWDTGNTGLAAFDVSAGNGAEMLWFQPFRSSMQPILFTATGELVTNDFRHLEDGRTSDDVVVVDLATGRMKARVPTGAERLNGMFLCPGWDRDLYYCTFGVVARIRAQSM